MLFTVKLGSEPFYSPVGLTSMAYGIYVVHVVPGWQGPIRLVLRRSGERLFTVWGDEAVVGRYHRVLLPLYPHWGQSWAVAGGTLGITGEHGLCACCHSVFDSPITALLRELTATPPLSEGPVDWDEAECDD